MRAVRLGLVVAWILSAGSVAWSLEGDQFFAWGKQLDDVTDVLNAKVQVEIELALELLNAKPSRDRKSCHQVVKRIVPRFRQFIFQDIEIWTANSPLVARIPATPEEELEYREKYFYRNTHFFDVGTKVPPSPTIEVNGVRMGTDKLAHFFSEGWLYYKWRRDYVKQGLSPEEIERRVINRGMWWERTILGLVSSGVFSLGDLEANHRGMLFLVSLCDGENPGLRLEADGWRYVGDFDFRDHVTPEWDETYQPPVFGKRRWNKVRPALLDYCPLLEHPAVVARRKDYASRDEVTPTERWVTAWVEEGRLADPRRFSIEALCHEERLLPNPGELEGTASP